MTHVTKLMATAVIAFSRLAHNDSTTDRAAVRHLPLFLYRRAGSCAQNRCLCNSCFCERDEEIKIFDILDQDPRDIDIDMDIQTCLYIYMHHNRRRRPFGYDPTAARVGQAPLRSSDGRCFLLED